MDLKLKDVADLLNVSKTTIRRWLADGKIPAYRINNQYRFNRQEIENWVMQHRLHHGEKSDTPIDDTDDEGDDDTSSSPVGSRQFSLYRAIHKGGVLVDVPGASKEVVIRNAMKKSAATLGLDAEVLTDLLLDREALMPTALNNGVGVPHTRDFLLTGHQDSVIVAFPEHPIAYGALDGQPVHTLFFLFACEDKRHLNLLAKIAHLTSQPQAQAFLRSRPNKEELLAFIKEWEAQIQPALAQ